MDVLVSYDHSYSFTAESNKMDSAILKIEHLQFSLQQEILSNCMFK